jgi:hypothetical protein
MSERTMDEPTNEPPIVKSEESARQGVTGHNVRYVLAISFSAAVVALVIVWIVVSPH